MEEIISSTVVHVYKGKNHSILLNDELFRGCLYLLFQKFKVTSWPEEDYGKFFSGDSYIILNVSVQACTACYIILGVAVPVCYCFLGW